MDKTDENAAREAETNIADALEAVLALNESEWEQIEELPKETVRALGAVARLSPEQLRVARALLELRVVRSLLEPKFWPPGSEQQRAWESNWDQLVSRFDRASKRLGQTSEEPPD